MRKILILLSVFFSFAASAQRLQTAGSYGYQFQRLAIDTLMGLPKDTFAVPASLLSIPFIANKAGTLYTWNISTNVWDAFSGGGSTYTASRGLNLFGTDFRLGGSVDSNVVITVNGNNEFQIKKTIGDYSFGFITRDTISGGDPFGNKQSFGFVTSRTLEFPSYSGMNYKGGAQDGLIYSIKDSARFHTHGGDFGQALKASMTFGKMAGYTGRSVYMLGDGAAPNEGVAINISDATFSGSSTTSNYKYAKGYLFGYRAYIVMPANDTLENFGGYDIAAFNSGHIKNTYDYRGGFFGETVAARVPNPWFLFGYSQRSKSYIAGSVGIGDSSIDASAKLDIKSTTKGILIPRMTTAQKNAIVSPATSLMVFDITLNGYYFWDGVAWTSMATGNLIVDSIGTTGTDVIVVRNDSLLHRLITAGSGIVVDTLPTGEIEISATAGGASFTALSDVPASYSGQALKVVSVNAAETALEFTTPSGGGSSDFGIIQSATYTLTSTTNVQKIFDAVANGSITVTANTTYQFECLVYLTSMSASSGNCGFDVLGAGTATFTSVNWMAVSRDITGVSSAQTASSFFSSAAANVGPLTASSTGTQFYGVIRGTIRVNTGGTIIPSINLTTAAAAVVEPNSYFKLTPIGNGSVTSW